MGIDVYLRWPGQTEAEQQAQYTGYSIAHGHVGYLREAYHGAPYATKVLASEAYESGEAAIPAKTLRERLPQVLEIAKERARTVYKKTLSDDAPELKSFRDFVDLAEKKEQEHGGITVVFSG